jgi:hypothetical protein
MRMAVSTAKLMQRAEELQREAESDNRFFDDRWAQLEATARARQRRIEEAERLAHAFRTRARRLLAALTGTIVVASIAGALIASSATTIVVAIVVSLAACAAFFVASQTVRAAARASVFSAEARYRAAEQRRTTSVE